MPTPFDDVSPATRNVMRANRSRDTGPEMVVRRLAHAMGYRFRLGGRGLPGRPDLAFGPRRSVVFVNGCYWHHHRCGPRGDALPATRTGFWSAKFAANRARDAAALAALAASGWSALVVWECETRDRDALAARLLAHLGPPGPASHATRAPDDEISPDSWPSEIAREAVPPSDRACPDSTTADRQCPTPSPRPAPRRNRAAAP